MENCKKSFTCIVFVLNGSCSSRNAPPRRTLSRFYNPRPPKRARGARREIRTLGTLLLSYPAISWESSRIELAPSAMSKGREFSPLISTIRRAPLANHLAASGLAPPHQTTQDTPSVVLTHVATKALRNLHLRI